MKFLPALPEMCLSFWVSVYPGSFFPLFFVLIPTRINFHFDHLQLWNAWSSKDRRGPDGRPIRWHPTMGSLAAGVLSRRFIFWSFHRCKRKSETKPTWFFSWILQIALYWNQLLPESNSFSLTCLTEKHLRSPSTAWVTPAMATLGSICRRNMRQSKYRASFFELGACLPTFATQFIYCKFVVELGMTDISSSWSQKGSGCGSQLARPMWISPLDVGSWFGPQRDDLRFCWGTPWRSTWWSLCLSWPPNWGRRKPILWRETNISWVFDGFW